VNNSFFSMSLKKLANPSLDQSGNEISPKETWCSTEVPFELPENIELEGKILSLKLYSNATWKKCLRYTLYFLTLGVVYLFCRWFPNLFIKLAFKEAPVEEAEWIVVQGTGNTLPRVII